MVSSVGLAVWALFASSEPERFAAQSARVHVNPNCNDRFLNSQGAEVEKYAYELHR